MLEDFSVDEMQASTNSVRQSVVDAVCPNRKGYLRSFKSLLHAALVFCVVLSAGCIETGTFSRRHK